MKNLAVLSLSLGAKLKCSEGVIEISHKQNIEKLMIRFGMAEWKPKMTPTTLGLDKGVGLGSPDLEDPTLHRTIVRSLIYAMTGTRPDLCCIVTRIFQNISKPIEASLTAAKHALRYSRGTIKQNLSF